MRQTVSTIPPEAQGGKSRRACQAVIGLPEFSRAGTAMLYLPIPGEVDTTEIAEAAWREGKIVLVPKVDVPRRRMDAIRCDSLEDAAMTGAYGIREPRGGQPWPVGGIDFIIVPALAYDRRGYRLGRGGGYYDRFLAQPGLRAVTCGLAFAEQLVDELPTAPHDRAVMMLVTDEEILRFQR